jgi:hypothetical protein
MDVMHIKQNVCPNMLGYLLVEKDTTTVQKYMEDANNHHRLYLKKVETSLTYFKRQAPYVLRKVEKF